MNLREYSDIMQSYIWKFQRKIFFYIFIHRFSRQFNPLLWRWCAAHNECRKIGPAKLIVFRMAGNELKSRLTRRRRSSWTPHAIASSSIHRAHCLLFILFISSPPRSAFWQLRRLVLRCASCIRCSIYFWWRSKRIAFRNGQNCECRPVAGQRLTRKMQRIPCKRVPRPFAFVPVSD